VKKDDDDILPLGFSDKKLEAAKGKKGVNKRDFFAAWDDIEQIDIDYTTDQVLADTGPEGTFDILAERDYDTLLEYQNI
jgi:hypothetical protein